MDGNGDVSSAPRDGDTARRARVSRLLLYVYGT